MDQYLYKFLVLNGHLGIPQLGSFSIQQEPAILDNESGFLYPPRPVISFSEKEIPLPEKAFFDFISGEMGIDEVVAIQQFNDFTNQFRNQLQENGSVVLNGVGKLNRGEDSEITFQPATDLSAFLSPLQMSESVMLSESDIDPEESKPDYWWFYAIILLVLGLGALVYYYI
jgi:hypothetical protein